MGVGCGRNPGHTVAKLHAHIWSSCEDTLGTPNRLWTCWLHPPRVSRPRQCYSQADFIHLRGQLVIPSSPCGGDILFIPINQTNNDCLCTKHQLREMLYSLKVNIRPRVPNIELIQGTASLELIGWIWRCKITKLKEHAFFLDRPTGARIYTARRRR